MFVSKPAAHALHRIAQKLTLQPPKEVDRIEVANASAGTEEIRWEKVLELRNQIDAGTFDIESRMDFAVRRLMADLDGGVDDIEA